MSAHSSIDMPSWLNVLGGLIDRTRGFWRSLGTIESNAYRDKLDEVALDRPIFVAGLARSGSTIVLELLAEHEDAATHQYRDFPPIYIPMFWNRAFGQIYGKGAPPVERAHKDRILVTPESPEAMEEVLWMTFFPHCHDVQHSHVLDKSTSHPEFERFYLDHLKKILLVRKGKRYISKGNYNVTRLGYLAKLLPSARIIVPIREPVSHVASLMKQHRLFVNEERRDPRILNHMRRVGHFEFGLDRRVVHCGSDSVAVSVEELWHSGEDARGYARQWAAIYGLIANQLEEDAGLRGRIFLLRYEDLCQVPSQTLQSIFDHVELPISSRQLQQAAARVSFPSYYKPEFSNAVVEAIHHETAEVAGKLGYDKIDIKEY